MQIIIGSLMLWMSFTVQGLMDNVCNLVSRFFVATYTDLVVLGT